MDDDKLDVIEFLWILVLIVIMRLIMELIL